MSIGNASFSRHGYHMDRRPNRKRWVGTFAAVVAGLAMANGVCRSDDTKGERKPGTVITNSIGMELAYIPAGKFLMGSPDTDDLAKDDEKPRHAVRITKPFRLGVYEVTQGQWEAVMETTPWKGKPLAKEGNRYAVTWVRWIDADDFCQTLTDKERREGWLRAGESYRLPTEAEWEYACRAGSTTRFHFGDDKGSLKKYGWYRANAKRVGEEYAHEVGHKQANAWGLYDMHGNTFEWCADWYGKDYYGRSLEADPQGPPTGGQRVLRGGCWSGAHSYSRSATRFWSPQGGMSSFIGFRVARGIASSK